jgi:hypothetical protein
MLQPGRGAVPVDVFAESDAWFARLRTNGRALTFALVTFVGLSTPVASSRVSAAF